MEPLLTTILGWGATFAPRGWAFCAGQLLAISQYTAVFSLVGTTYGGDGRTTFQLPDLRGRVPIAAGQGPGTNFHPQGALSGAESQTLTVAELPPHNHTLAGNVSVELPCHSQAGNQNQPNGNYPSAGEAVGRSSFTPPVYADTTDSTMAPPTVTNSLQVGLTGSGQPFSIMQPFQAIQFIFALVGIFPSRN